MIIRALGANVTEWLKNDAAKIDRFEGKWAAEVIRERGTPTLLVVGSLDLRWLIEGYLVSAWIRQAKHPDYTFKIYEGLGHQLSLEMEEQIKHEKHGVIANSRAGPIDRQVVEYIVEWLKIRAKSCFVGSVWVNLKSCDALL